MKIGLAPSVDVSWISTAVETLYRLGVAPNIRVQLFRSPDIAASISEGFFLVANFSNCLSGSVIDATSCNISTAELSALEALYYSTDGSHWAWVPTSSDGAVWTFPNATISDPCSFSWQGITCSKSNISVGTCSIEQLNLQEYNLRGSLPDEIGLLTGLTYLEVSSNYLNSTIPSNLSLLTNLVGIGLSSNSLNGQISSQISTLTSLQILYLDTNEFSKTIPSELSALKNLQQMGLYQNKLTGSIPSQISTLTNLQILYLDANELSKTVPAELFALTNLQQIGLHQNKITGPIPSQISALTNLQYLFLYQNKLAGSIPSQISTLINLQILYLDTNEFSKTIPSELSTLTSLKNLFLNANKLTGSIPSQISTLTNLQYLFLNENGLTGSISSQISTLKNLQYLFLNENGLTGPISSQISVLTNLQYLYLNENKLSSTIPSELSTLTNLVGLFLESNEAIVGQIPSELSTLINLQILYLYTNELSKTIPSELSALTSLQSLSLARNQLSGAIPSQLSALTNLLSLLLDVNMLKGSIPSVLSNLYRLQALYLNDNELSKSIPDMFVDMINLSILDLHDNRFDGRLILSSLYVLKPSLVYVDLSSNYLNGDPFFFIGFPRIEYVNVSWNHFDDILSLRSASALTDITSSLKFIDLSSNSLTGSLPDTVGRVFPGLLVFEASTNCFKSYIPESICEMSNLTTILMNKLGSQCSTSSLRNVWNTFSTHVISNSHTIPSCLLTLPNLQTAHFISNYLYGTLSEVSASLESLSLVGNALVGSIPKSIQQSNKLAKLQVSLNRLSGTLDDDAFQHLPLNSSIDMYSNRISADIPSSLASFTKNNVDILTGNLFYCRDGEAPRNLRNADSYNCGSSSIDFYKYVFLATGIFLVVALTLLICLWKTKNSIFKNHLFIKYFLAAGPFPRHLFSALANKNFLLTSLFVSLFMVIFNVVMKTEEESPHDGSTFQNSYGTHQVEYGWTSTFAYVHGILPFILISIALLVTIFAYLHNIEKFNTSDERIIKNADRGSVRYGDEAGVIAQENADLKGSSKSSSLKCSGEALSWPVVELFSNSHYRWFIFLQLLNIAMVTAVNVLYIFIEDDNYRISVEGIYKKGIVPIALSIFKMMWSNTFVVYMIKYGIRSKLPSNVVFGHYVLASLYIYVLVPIVTVYFTDVSCFYYAIKPIPSITEVFDGLYPYITCGPFVGCKLSYIPIKIMRLISPSWIYSYQCGFAILINYIPAVLAKYTIAGLFLPALKLVLLTFPPSSWIRNVWIVRMLMPYTLNAMYVDKSVDVLDSIGRKQFRTYRYLSNLMIDVVMLFTFGIYGPFLVFIIVTSLLVNELVNHLQAGSLKYDIDLELKMDNSTNSNNNNNNNTTTNNNNITNSSSSSSSSDSSNSSSSSSSHKNNHIFVNQASIIGDSHSGKATVTFSSLHSPGQGLALEDSAEAAAGEQVDSKLQNSGENHTELNLASPLEDIYLSNSKSLFFAMWKPMILAILLFSTLILFDMIADVYTNIPGLVAVSCFYFVIILCYYSRTTMAKFTTCSSSTSCCCGCKKVDDLKEIERRSVLEMKYIQ